METYTTDAINIKTYPISENDNIVVMFSKEMGLIKGIARGVKNPKSKLGARMQSFVANTLVMNQKRNLDTIKEASALNTFNKLRYDLDKLTMAFYIVEVVNTFCAADNKDKEQNEAIYNVLYKTLDNIQASKDRVQITLSAIKFQLAIMNELGFGIEFDKCLKCSKKPEGTVLFSIETGGITCLDCIISGTNVVRLNEKLRIFLSTLNKTPVDEKTKYDNLVNEKVTDACFNLLKKYIEITGTKKSKVAKIIQATAVSRKEKIYG